MTTKDFYKTLDSDFDALIEQYGSANTQGQSLENQKAYAFLIWFLKFYVRRNGFMPYITQEEEDGTCELILPYWNEDGQIETYCMIYAKWQPESECEQALDSKEFFKGLARFEAVLMGQKQSTNSAVKEQMEDFLVHTKQNKPVKFIFLSLCKKDSSPSPKYSGGPRTVTVSDTIRDFQNKNEKTYIEWFDIDQFKYDYIDKNYKKIQPEQPLKVRVDLEEEPITLKIARVSKNKRDVIHIENPFESYIFLVKPKAIFELFERYGFSLFFKNIRNPLVQTEINQIIETTAADNTPYFWYYNNGITAVTNGMDTLGTNALQLKIAGLQVINGAQTVYSIFKIYKDFSPARRKRMDEEMLVTFRLVRSGGKTFNMNITRYTNSQNALSGRDFYANDDIQIKLQNAFFNTPIWYEKRDGEFREYPKNVRVESNTLFAIAYLVFFLQEPNKFVQQARGKEMLFLTKADHPNGLYDSIFHSRITKEELLAAYFMLDIAFSDTRSAFFVDNSPRPDIYHILALSCNCLKKHFMLGDDLPLAEKIIELYEKGEKEILHKALELSLQFWLQNLEADIANGEIDNLQTALVSPTYFYSVRSRFEVVRI